jgi:hypothetical protein
MFFIWIILAGILQVTVLNDFNLLVILTVFAGLRKGALKGLLIGAAAGMFAGILSASSFKMNVGLYGMVGFLSGFAKNSVYFYKENFFTDMIFALFGLSVFYASYFFLKGGFHVSALGTVIFSALISPVVFRVVRG